MATQAEAVRKKKTIWAWTIATFFGTGLGKPGPGTWASVATILVWADCAWAFHPSPTHMLVGIYIGIVAAIAIGVPAATIVARESGKKDPGFVVIDEVAGQAIALLFCPFDLHHAILSLVLFRAFDIVKPFPVRQLEALPEGWGIMFDDVAAGLYALAAAALARVWI